jgi:hypothetical protein
MSELVRVALLRGAVAQDIHMRACVDDAGDAGDRANLAAADVLYFARTIDPDVVAERLAAYPGCAICAGATEDGTLLLAVRAGRGVGGGDRAELVASIVHALLAWGDDVDVAVVTARG